MEVVRAVEQRSKSPYRWDEWTDGRARKAISGVDFKTTPQGFASSVHSWARRHGYVATTSISKDETAVTFALKKKKKADRNNPTSGKSRTRKR